MTKIKELLCTETISAIVVNLIYLFILVSGNHNYGYTYYYQFHTTYNIKIMQSSSGIYCIQINKVNVHCIQNTLPMSFDEVFVYVSDPWFDPFDSNYGTLKDLKIYDSGM